MSHTMSGHVSYFAMLYDFAMPVPARSTIYSSVRHYFARYPVDTGLFVSGAMDGIVKLWDTNTLEVALEFDLKDKVKNEQSSSEL